MPVTFNETVFVLKTFSSEEYDRSYRRPENVQVDLLKEARDRWKLYEFLENPQVVEAVPNSNV